MAGKDNQYDTFDSGAGPLIKEKGDYAHRDSNGGLAAKDDDGQDKEQGIPAVPMK